MTKKIITAVDKYKSLSLSGYKAFYEKQNIPIKNITLIFGHNSAGKSSIIESLILLKETLKNYKITSLASKGPFKLPTFKEIISGGDNNIFPLKISSSCNFSRETNTLAKKYKTDEENEPSWKKSFLEKITYTDNAKVERRFDWKNGRAILSGLTLYPVDDSEMPDPNLDEEYNFIVKYDVEQYSTKKHKNIFFPETLDNENKSNFYVIKYRDDYRINHPYFDQVRELFYDKNFIQKLVFSLIKSKYRYVGTGISSLRIYDGFEKAQRTKMIEEYEYFIQKFNIHDDNLPKIKGGLLSTNKRINYDQLSNFDSQSSGFRRGMTSLIFPSNNNQEINKLLQDFKSDKKIDKIIDELLIDYFKTTYFLFQGCAKILTKRNNILGSILEFKNKFSIRNRVIQDAEENLIRKLYNFKLPSITLNRILSEEEDFLNNIVPLSVNRPEFTSVYEYQGIQTDNVGISGEYMSDIIYGQKKQTIDEINYWLKAIGLNFIVKPKKFKESNIFQLKIIDRSRKVKLKGKTIQIELEINLKEAGTGIQSILPIIINSILSKNKTLTIQEPERSLHPKYQINLASLFVDMVKKRGNSFIIETHSEYIVYKFMNLVRNGEISVDDLSFNYVIKTENGSDIKHLRMGEDGSFIDEWPEGFFTERFTAFKG